MSNKKKNKNKKNKLKILQTIAWILTAYLLVNLYIYVTGKINHFIFWVSLIVIAIISWKVIPTLKRKIENS